MAAVAGRPSTSSGPRRHPKLLSVFPAPPPVSQSYLVLDIETVLDAELPIVPVADNERLPAPPHHRVVVIGALLLDPSYEVRRLGIVGDAKDEPGMLRDFARLLEERRPSLITFNGRSF